MVYTPRLLIFAPNVGNEVVDVIPMDEIVDINISPEDAAKIRRASILGSLDEDEMEEGNSESLQTSKSSQEITIQTKPEGYNSGRSYRVSPHS